MRDDLRTLTLVADSRRYDLAVPLGAPVSDVLAALGIGTSVSPLAVATPAGRVYGPQELLDEDIPDGTVLVVLPMTTHAVHRDVVQLDRSAAAHGRRRTSSADGAGSRWTDQSTLTRMSLHVDDATRRRSDLNAGSAPAASAEGPAGGTARGRSGAVPVQAWWILLIGAAATAIAVGLLFDPAAASWVPPAILLALLAGLALGHRFSDGTALGLITVIPLVAVAAGMTLPWSGPGAHGLGLLSGLVLALAALGVLRLWTAGHVELMLILLVGAVASIVGIGTVLGWPAAATAAVVAGLVPPTLRSLPSATMSVDPGHLVDVSRLSTTVWAVRAEPPRPSRRLRRPELDAVFSRARDVTAVGSIYAAGALAVAAWVVSLTTTIEGWPRYATLAFFLVLTAAVGYQSRSVRDPAPRYALIAAAALVAAAGTRYALVTWPGSAVTPLVSVAILLGVLTLIGSVSLAGGFRSTRLSRLSDVLESLSVALSLPLGIIAAGGIEALRSLTSG